MRKKDYYQVLRIDKDATPEEINKAFRSLARRFHPDITTEDPAWAEEMFKAISEAYSVLANPEQRAIYDQIHGFDVFRARKREGMDPESWWEEEVFMYKDDPSTRTVRSPFSYVRPDQYEDKMYYKEKGYRIVHAGPTKKTSIIWRIKNRIMWFLSIFSFLKRERAQPTTAAESDKTQNPDLNKEPHKIKTKKEKKGRLF